MILTDGFGERYGGFEIDTKSIKLHSTNRHKLVLPYSGPLPEPFAETTRPTLRIVLDPLQAPFVSVYADTPDRLFLRADVKCSQDEVIGILDSLFAQKSTGLDLRWEAMLAARYEDWKVLIQHPASVVRTLSAENREKLLAALREAES